MRSGMALDLYPRAGGARCPSMDTRCPARNGYGPRSVSTDGIPEDVAAFLQSDIESVRQLEALLLLRAQRRSWSARDVSTELRSGVAWSEQQLEGLRAKGLL